MARVALGSGGGHDALLVCPCLPNCPKGDSCGIRCRNNRFALRIVPTMRFDIMMRYPRSWCPTPRRDRFRQFLGWESYVVCPGVHCSIVIGEDSHALPKLDR